MIVIVIVQRVERDGRRGAGPGAGRRRRAGRAGGQGERVRVAPGAVPRARARPARAPRHLRAQVLQHAPAHGDYSQTTCPPTTHATVLPRTLFHLRMGAAQLCHV